MTRRDITASSGDAEPMEITHLGDLTPDPSNARAHNPRNVGQVVRSLSDHGFGRSILLARDGTIIAGNATADAAGQIGMEDVQVVDSDGTKVIAIRRTDIESGTERFVALALADNRAAELASWDTVVLAQLADDGQVTVSDHWTDDEWRALMSKGASDIAGDDEAETCDCCGQAIRAR